MRLPAPLQPALAVLLAGLLGTLTATAGCTLDDECVRGAVAVDGKCVCPAGTTRVPLSGSLEECRADDAGADDAALPDAALDAAPPDAAPDEGTPDAGPCGLTCPTDAPVCDATTGACVECTDDDARACAADTPVCDAPTHRCVPCNADADCAARAATPVCDAPRHACVACNADADCTSLTAPECDLAAHTCGPCTADTACAARPGATVCGGGACVECTSADRSACGPNVCDVTAHACSALPAGATGLCQTCVSDAQCRTGQLCVPMTFDTPARPVGSYCLWRLDASGAGAPNGDCFAVRPYVRALPAATSLDGVPATVCGLAVTTCPAMNDFRTANCMTLDAAGDARCGAAGFADGVCRAAGPTTNLCTVECLSDLDCGTGSACDTTVTPRVCRL